MTTAAPSRFAAAEFVLSKHKGELPDKREDIRGRHVLDAHGDSLGVVERVILDGGRGHVRLMEVRIHTGFLGLSRRTVPVPVDCIIRMEPESIYINCSKERLEKAPAYDPAHIDRAGVQRIFNHFKCSAYWDESYVAPLFHAHHHTSMHLHHHHAH